MTASEPVDTAKLRKLWLVQCGPCDYGLVEYGCTCPPGDPRWLIGNLCDELDRRRVECTELRADLTEAKELLAYAPANAIEAEGRAA